MILVALLIAVVAAAIFLFALLIFASPAAAEPSVQARFVVALKERKAISEIRFSCNPGRSFPSKG